MSSHWLLACARRKVVMESAPLTETGVTARRECESVA
jgi:hypothetical protein